MPNSNVYQFTPDADVVDQMSTVQPEQVHTGDDLADESLMRVNVETEAVRLLMDAAEAMNPAFRAPAPQAETDPWSMYNAA